jgi:pimeloyl-ACP methyl ester carboxylesterase
METNSPHSPESARNVQRSLDLSHWLARNMPTSFTFDSFPEDPTLQKDATRFRLRHKIAFTLFEIGFDHHAGVVHLCLSHMRSVFSDHQQNLECYPEWQSYLRKHVPPLLVLWGRYDPSFLVDGAFAYKRDAPQAQIHVLEAGHFALDEAADEVASLTAAFLARLPM